MLSKREALDVEKEQECGTCYHTHAPSEHAAGKLGQVPAGEIERAWERIAASEDRERERLFLRNRRLHDENKRLNAKIRSLAEELRTRRYEVRERERSHRIWAKEYQSYIALRQDHEQMQERLKWALALLSGEANMVTEILSSYWVGPLVPVHPDMRAEWAKKVLEGGWRAVSTMRIES